MRGRAFVFVTFICTAWISVRLLIHGNGPDEIRLPAYGKDTMKQRPNLAIAGLRPKNGGRLVHRAQPRAHNQAERFEYSLKPSSRTATVAPVIEFLEPPAQEQASTRAVMGATALPELSVMPLSIPDDRPAGKRPRAFEIHAYTFWRRGSDPDLRLGNGIYGGSQSALAITVPLRRFQRPESAARLAFVSRYSAAMGDMPDRELAAGFQWRPLAWLPAQIALERRFRFGRADAVAAFIAGGYDGARLPGGFVGDGYGQAGIVTGSDGGPFADVQMHAQQPLVSDARRAVAMGVGLWGGGQDKHLRLDVGPSIRAHLPLGVTQMRVDASWRFRIAGTARPGSGPAVTLSTSF